MQQPLFEFRLTLRIPISAHMRPNPPLKSDPACIAFRSLSTSRFLGSAQRFGAGGARLASFVRPMWAGSAKTASGVPSPSSPRAIVAHSAVRSALVSSGFTSCSALFQLKRLGRELQRCGLPAHLRLTRPSHGLGYTDSSIRPNLSLNLTPPALPAVLSQPPASSAPFSASAQAGPVSYVR